MMVAASIPPITVVPRMRRETAPEPVAITSGNTPRMKANARSGERGIVERLAALVLGLGELHDQDGVLGREADDHHEADLREHVHLEPAHPERAERAEYRDRRAQQHPERERPALVL